jgi:hypothetical protein
VRILAYRRILGDQAINILSKIEVAKENVVEVTVIPKQ